MTDTEKLDYLAGRAEKWEGGILIGKYGDKAYIVMDCGRFEGEGGSLSDAIDKAYKAAKEREGWKYFMTS